MFWTRVLTKSTARHEVVVEGEPLVLPSGVTRVTASRPPPSRSAPADLTSSFTMSINLLLWRSCRRPPAEVPPEAPESTQGAKHARSHHTSRLERMELCKIGIRCKNKSFIPTIWSRDQSPAKIYELRSNLNSWKWSVRYCHDHLSQVFLFEWIGPQ